MQQDEWIDKRAFAVDHISSYDPNSGPPTNGMDYLRSVIQESRKFSKLMVAPKPEPSPAKRVNILDQFASLLREEKVCHFFLLSCRHVLSSSHLVSRFSPVFIFFLIFFFF